MVQFVAVYKKSPVNNFDAQAWREALNINAPANPQQQNAVDFQQGYFGGGLQCFGVRPQNFHWRLSANDSERLVILGRGVVWNWFAARPIAPEQFWLRFQQDYAQYGIEFLKQLQGQFSFVLFDKAQQRLYAFRDPVGFHPLYYAESAGSVIVSSHFRPLLHLKKNDRRLSPLGVVSFFLFGFNLAPATLIEGIYRLFPGEYLACDHNGGLKKQRYWFLPPCMPQNKTIEEFSAEIRNQVTAVVEKHVDGENDCGLFLSGGVDSSVIAGILAKRFSRPLKSYTFGLEITGSRVNYGRDLAYARVVAAAFGLNHHEVVLDRNFSIATVLKTVVPQLDSLLLTPNVMTKFYLLQKARAEGVPVVLTGSNAGAVFDAYSQKTLRKKVDLQSSAIEMLYQFKNRLLPLREIQRLFPDFAATGRELIDFCLAEYMRQVQAEAVIERMEATLNLMQCSEKTITVHHNAAWPHGVEVEIPFADPQLWLLGTQLPLHLKSGEAGYPAKFLLRKAFAEFLPEEILSRESTGFPGYYWNQGELDSLQRVIFSDKILRRAPMMDPAALRQIVKDDKESLKKSAGKRTWGITMFVLWYLSFIAGQNLNELSS